MAFYHLIDKSSLLTAHFRLFSKIFIGSFCDKTCYKKAQRCQQHYYSCDTRVQKEHDAKSAEDCQYSCKELSKSHQKSVGKGIHICDDSADQIAGRMGIQIRQRKFLYLLHSFISQISGNTESHPVIAGRQHPLSRCRENSYQNNGKDQPFHSFKVHFSNPQHIVDGVSAEDRYQKLSRHTDCSAEDTEDHKEAVRPDTAEYSEKSFLLFHTALSPFPYWLSYISLYIWQDSNSSSWVPHPTVFPSSSTRI